MTSSSTRRSLLPLAALALAAASCSDTQAGEALVQAEAVAPGSPDSPDASGARVAPDPPLAAFRTELLDFAFRAATAMPLVPHAKNRAKSQAEVVDACFALDQAELALGYVGQIEGWRRGAGYADYAFQRASRGELDGVERYLDLAEQVVVWSSPDEQAWRRDLIRAKIAKTHRLLGEDDRAAELETDAEPSALIETGAVEAALVSREDVATRLGEIDAEMASQDLDLVRNGLAFCAELFDRFYEDQELRSRAEARVLAYPTTLPPYVRIELLMQLAESALAHEDGRKALELVDATQHVVDGIEWLPADLIPLQARLAALRHRAGEPEKARAALAATVAFYDAQRERIVDIWRAGALRPIAEAWHAIGDDAAALEVYRRAVEEGLVNQNSRPRAQDLVTTACSMAVHGVEPDAALWERLRAAFGGMSAPW